MNRKTMWLAMCLLTPALYAHAEVPFFTREQVLDVFTRFNPTVLDKAQQDKEYKDVLDLFLDNYHKEVTPANETELLAAVRNFDTSIRLDKLKKDYRGKWLYAHMAGQPVEVINREFTKGVCEEMAHVWAVAVQVRNYQLDQAKTEMVRLRKDSSNDSQRAAQEQALQQKIEALCTETKVLTKNPGSYITMVAENYQASVERELMEKTFSVQQSSAEQSTQQARSTTNLQLKSKHKKPVAE